MRKLERKPLSFSTTMRNPERIPSFLNCIKPFESRILTNEIILKIVKQVINAKLYSPNSITSNREYRSIYFDEDRKFNDSQLNNILEGSPQNHKEVGFDKGWPSRFDTWFKLSMELGFIFYEIGKPIEISKSGHMLCDAYTDDQGVPDNEKIQNIFLNALVKYQTNNPFRRNANNNAPFTLLLRVIYLLRNDNSTGTKYLSRGEIPFITCWPDNNADKLYRYIKNFRNEFGLNPSNEQVYEKCLSLLNSDNQIRFKMVQIVKEGVDDFIRKMRITGLISLRGMGRYVDFNEIQREKIHYVIDKYSNIKTFPDKHSYFLYVGEIDPKFIEIQADSSFDLENIRLSALGKLAIHYEKSFVLDELINLAKSKPTKDKILKDLSETTRLEFLTSISLKQQFPKSIIRPNYPIDDEGLPTYTAGGGVADIEVADEESDSLIEVTMIKNRNQGSLEIPATTRHLLDMKENSIKNNCFSVFIAPYVHADAIFMIGFAKYQYNVDIIGLTIEKYTNVLGSLMELSDFLSVTSE